MHGNTVQILKFGDHNEVIVDVAELEKMFSHPDVKDRKVVTFSIIGAFRTGKSFFLDYCLRYLYANYKSIKSSTNVGREKNWMGSDTEALNGFSWRAGVKRDTTGIIMWNDIFLHTIKTTGEKVAIIVLDTQGLFDNESSPVENSRIFAISTLISSIQILNLSRRIQEDQLQYLQFATEFAKFAARDGQGTTTTPFQNLIFLIRDWENKEEFALGKEGGSKYLKEVLQVKDGQKPELKSVRESISSSFEKVGCCLLSYPGSDVAGSKNYNGQWKLMASEFKDVLMITIEKLLDPENLILKKINGDDLKASELKNYIKCLPSLFLSDTQPLAKSMYEFAIDKQMTVLIEKCLNFYKQTRAKSQKMWTEDNLNVFHDMSSSKALIMFKEMKKMGNSTHENKHKGQLEAAMLELNKVWQEETIKSMRQIREAKEKKERAIEEKRIMEQKAIEAENLAKANHLKLEHEKQIRKRNEEEIENQKRKIREAENLAKTRQEELEQEKQARKRNEEKLQAQRRELERQSYMSCPVAAPSMGFDMSRLLRELQSEPFQGIPGPSYASSGMGSRGNMFREMQSGPFQSFQGPSYASSGMGSRMLCQGFTKQGRPCRNPPRSGSSTCRHH